MTYPSKAAHTRLRRGRRRWAVLVSAALLPLSVGCDRVPGPSGFDVLIPAGSADAPSADLLAGLPQRRDVGRLVLTFEQGDVLTVRNEDRVAHTVGVVSVRPGETATYRFGWPGVFVGACTLLGGQEIAVEVRGAG